MTGVGWTCVSHFSQSCPNLFGQRVHPSSCKGETRIFWDCPTQQCQRLDPCVSQIDIRSKLKTCDSTKTSRLMLKVCFLNPFWLVSPLCHKTDPFIVDGGRHYLCNITWMKLILACFVWSEVARKPRWLRGKEETSIFVTSIPAGYICCIQRYQRQVDLQLERIVSHYTKVFLMMLAEECWRVYWIPVGGYRKLSSLLHW